MESDIEWNPIVPKTLQRQLKWEFSIFMILLMVEIFLTILFGLSYTTIFHADQLLNFDEIYQDVLELGPEEAFRINNLPEGVEIEVINDNNQIIDQYNSKRRPGYKYSQKEINMFLNNHYLDIYAHYPEDDSQEFVLFFVPNVDNSTPLDAIFFSVGFFLLLVFLTIHVISQRLGYKFLTPLNALMHGVRTIQNGDYKAEIEFISNSEFDQVRDAINDLSSNLSKEILKRKEVEASRNQLIVDISHDLKTPLTNVIGYSEVLLRNLHQAPHQDQQHREMKRYLEIISKNGKQANDLLQDLAELSQLQAPNLKIVCKSVDLPEFLREFAISNIPELEEAGFQYVFEIPEEEIACEIDEQKLRRAFQNLVDNAIKYNTEGTELKIRLLEDEKNIRLVFQDDGIGIPHAYQADIFEPFIRADQDRNRSTGGSGLGLAITKKIIEKHGGKISLYSDPSGSTFSILLSKKCTCDLKIDEIEIER
jgi:signal transduction histidine kinase